MRRSVLVFLLFVSLVPLTPVSGQAPPATRDSQQLRQAAAKLLQSGSPDDAVKAADLLDKASQIDARDAATHKAQAESGFWPFAVSITPFLSVVGVAFGFLFTNYQAREEAARQREADERKRFVDAVTLIQKTEDFSPAATFLSTFTTPPFDKLARKTGVTLLRDAKTFDNFNDLFNSFVEPVSSANLPQVVELLRHIHDDLGPLLIKANSQPGLDHLTPDELASYNLLIQERTFVGTRVAMVLRQQREPGQELDLNNLGFDGVDLTGADLRNAYIAPALWNLVNLDGADLRGITSYANGWFYNSAWWQAAHIDKPFLDYLTEHFPYDPTKSAYTNTLKTITAQSYAADLARLQAAAGETA